MVNFDSLWGALLITIGVEINVYYLVSKVCFVVTNGKDLAFV